MSISGLTVKHFGVDGNAFAIMGQVTSALKKGNRADLVDAFRKEAMSGNYDHLMQTCLEYVDVEMDEPDEDDIEDDSK